MARIEHKQLRVNFDVLKPFLCILLFSLLGCDSNRELSVFKEFKGKTEVEIYLSDYGLDSVPKEIESLKNVERLYISKDRNGWETLVPNTIIDPKEKKPPFRHLPNEITHLTTLQVLSLVNLDIVTLPEDIYKLKHLDSLFLFYNKLTISNELEKLGRLKQLKYLGLQGNYVTPADLEQLENSIPGIITNPGLR